MTQIRRLLLAGLLAFPVATEVAEAQRRMPRKALFAVVGAVVAGAAASAYVIGNEEGRGSFGACAQPACVAGVSIAAGSLVGYMIGREFDQLYALRYRHGAPLDLPNVTAGVEASALNLTVRDTLVAISGASGVQLLSSTARGVRPLARRAGGVRGITALDLAPGSGALTVGSPAGFYVFPPATGPGLLLREGGTSAVAATQQRVYFGVGTRIEAAPLDADTTRAWPGVELDAPARALHWDDARRLLWAATDSALLALRPDGDSLAVVSRLAIDAPARRLTGSGTMLLGAHGEEGLRLWDVSDPAAPVERVQWRTARFVYDVAMASPSRVLVAAGTEGMYVVDVSQPALSVVGLARELGFITTVVIDGEHAFVLDRYSDQLRRIALTAF